MRKEGVKHNRFELAAIGLLLGFALSGAVVSATTILVPFGYGLFLFGVYTITRSLFGRIHPALGKAFFSLTATLLVIELVMQSLLGLHLNLFVLKDLLQPGAEQHIGIAYLEIAIGSFGVFILFWCISALTKKQASRLNLKFIAGLMLAGLLVCEGTYALRYYKGDQNIISVKRAIPFFVSPHSYYIEKLLMPFLGERHPNPFSLETIKVTPPALEPATLPVGKNPKNLILIVMDSLRSVDIEETPSLAPAMQKWAAKGSLSLNYYSVSNCTHFGFYTLLSGKLATRFGEDRRRGFASSLMRDLAASGWTIATSEARSLDWYDTDALLLPSSTMRTDTSTATPSPDVAALEDTLKALREARDAGKRLAHLTYLNGTHFPYSEATDGSYDYMDTEANKERYLKAIQQFDKRLDSFLSQLESDGLLDDTLVVVTSDHGESFGEDGLVAHGGNLSPYQTRVPLLIVGSEKNAPKSHRGIRPFVEAIVTDTPKIETENQESPTILAGCSYEHPPTFAVLKDGITSHFNYEDGYLSAASDNTDKDAEREAGFILMQELAN